MNENPLPLERRLSRRRLPRRSVRAYLRLGGLDVGPDLALSLLDLSEGGAALVVKQAVEPGKEVSFGAEGQSHPRPILRIANVVWCRPAADGAYAIGICFQKNLAYNEYNDLTLPIREAEQRYRNSDPVAASNPTATAEADVQKTREEPQEAPDPQ